MRLAWRLCAFVLCMLFAAYVLAQESTWDKVRYCGGTLQSEVDPSDWNNHLSVSSDQVVLQLNDGRNIAIPAKSITGLSYGQQAHGRINSITKVGVPASESESVIFGLRRTRLHFIGIEFRPSDGKSSGLLLQGNKENYRAILKALENATGASVAALEKDREYLTDAPAAKSVNKPAPPVTKSADEPRKPAAPAPSTPPTLATATNGGRSKPVKSGILNISSRPRSPRLRWTVRPWVIHPLRSNLALDLIA